MICRRWFITFAGLAVALGICRTAHANSIAPYAYLWPGVVSISIIYAFPASVLAAFVERPFLTAAGIKRRPLVFSLRANLFSTIAGILLIPASYAGILALGPFWSLAVFVVSCAVEVLYLRQFSHQSFKRRWVIGGNVVSTAVLIGVPFISIAVDREYRRLAGILEPHEMWFGLLVLGLSVALFLASFLWRVKTASPDPGRADTHRQLPNKMNEWTATTERDLGEMIDVARAVMNPLARRIWELIRLPRPQKWVLRPWGDQGGGFWVVAVAGATCLYYNDIEGGFNSSLFSRWGIIDQYLCDQVELQDVMNGFAPGDSQHAVPAAPEAP